MPHVGIRAVASADLRRGRQPGKADPAPCPETGPFQRREGGIPVCLGTALAPSPGRTRSKRRGRFRLGARVPAGRGRPAEGFADGLDPMSATAENPSRDVSAETLAGRVGGTAPIQPLSCAKDSSHAVGTGCRRLSHPVPTDHRAGHGRQRRSAGHGTGHPTLALLTSSGTTVRSSVPSGRDAVPQRVSARIRVNGGATGHAREVPARPYCLLKPGSQRGGTRQGELPCLPRRLPDELPQSHRPNRDHPSGGFDHSRLTTSRRSGSARRPRQACWRGDTSGRTRTAVGCHGGVDAPAETVKVGLGERG